MCLLYCGQHSNVEDSSLMWFLFCLQFNCSLWHFCSFSLFQFLDFIKLCPQLRLNKPDSRSYISLFFNCGLDLESDLALGLPIEVLSEGLLHLVNTTQCTQVNTISVTTTPSTSTLPFSTPTPTPTHNPWLLAMPAQQFYSTDSTLEGH